MGILKPQNPIITYCYKEVPTVDIKVNFSVVK